MKLKKLMVDDDLIEDPVVATISQRTGLTPEPLYSNSLFFNHLKEESDPWKSGKELLWLTRNKGSFLKKCPGTRNYICCGYRILHFGAYCTMDCSYCILQGYYHPPVLQYFINQDKLYRELNAAFEMRSLLRIGTGEFTDSLIWESWTDLTPNLVRLFGQQMHAVLELKTKTTAIDRLKSIRHQRKTILSWSLNTPRIISTQERGTATLAARLRAAAQCQQWGYPLAFHFDPMIIYPGCAEEYFDVLKALFKSVSSSNIVWISLGTLRFMPFMQTIIKQRFPESNIIYGEFIPGLDGKMRYFKSLRINLYQRMVEWIRSMAPDLLVYLCMEDDVVWQQSFGFSPENSETLSSLLDASAKKYCDLK